MTDEEILKIRDECLSTLHQRRAMYNEYAKHYDQNIGENKLVSFVKKVASLIYLPDNIIFDLKKPKKEPLTPLETQFRREITNEFYSQKLNIMFYIEVTSALVYGSNFLKVYPTGKEVEVDVVPPYEIGVRYETISDISDRNQAIVHRKKIPLGALKSQYDLSILDSAKTTENEGFLNYIKDIKPLIPYGSKEGIMYPTEEEPVNRIRDIMKMGTSAELVEVDELWIWDDNIIDKLTGEKIEDYMVYTIIGDNVVSSGLNPCVAKYLPFIHINLSPISRYFWGESMLYYLVSMQDNINTLNKDIKRTISLMINPPTLLSGVISTPMKENMAKDLQTPGSVIDMLGGEVKIDQFVPKIDPKLLFELKNIYEQSLQESTNISQPVMGQVAKNVRSTGYAQMLSEFGSTELKLKAYLLEDVIENFMTIYAQTLQILKFSEFGNIDDYRIEVSSHSSSPIAKFDYTQMILGLMQAGIVPPDIAIDLLNIPRKEDILENIKIKAEQQAELIKEHPELIDIMAGGKKSVTKKGKIV